jgi:hypothetical protein
MRSNHRTNIAMGFGVENQGKTRLAGMVALRSGDPRPTRFFPVPAAISAIQPIARLRRFATYRHSSYRAVARCLREAARSGRCAGPRLAWPRAKSS